MSWARERFNAICTEAKLEKAESENARLRGALFQIQSMCGIHDAADACREIIKYVEEVLGREK